jgi:hypothetical protein
VLRVRLVGAQAGGEVIADHRPLPGRGPLSFRCERCGHPVDAHAAVTDLEAFAVTVAVVVCTLAVVWLLGRTM